MQPLSLSLVGRLNLAGRVVLGAIGLVAAGSIAAQSSPPQYTVSALAGTRGEAGSVDGVGAVARFNGPGDLAVDALGNVYVADTGNFTVRKIAPSGQVTTLAGAPGVSGNVDGTGTAARFGSLDGIGVDRRGNVYVADGANFSVRKISPAGVVTTLAGSVQGEADGTGAAAQFGVLRGMSVDLAGNVYVVHDAPTGVRRIMPDGVVTTISKGKQTLMGPIGTNNPFSRPVDVVIDSAGDFLVGADFEGDDTASYGVTKVSPTGVLKWAEVYSSPQLRAVNQTAFPAMAALARDVNGTLYISDPETKRVTRISRSGERLDVENAEAPFQAPRGVAVDAVGNVYVADFGSHTVVKAQPVWDASSTRLLGLSVRSRAGRDEQTLIAGVVVKGSGERPVLVRGVGPTLSGMGVGGVLNDPQVKIFDAQANQIAANDDWAPELGDTFARIGLQPLTANSKDAAISLAMGTGAYTAHVVGGDAATGVVLLEAYDADADGAGRLSALAVRSAAGIGDETLIAGFILEGDAPKTVLIRAVGPSLSRDGVAGVLADPRLTLFRGQEAVEASDDWGGGAALKEAFREVGLAEFVSEDSKDAALLVSLEPGAFTVHVTGANSTTGVALVEIYEVE